MNRKKGYCHCCGECVGTPLSRAVRDRDEKVFTPLHPSYYGNPLIGPTGGRRPGVFRENFLP
jgi:hypothetical protein